MILKSRKFGYGNSKWIGPICAILGLPLAWYFYHLSITGEEFKFHGLHFTLQSAVYAWWLMSALMGLVFLMGVYRCFEQFSGEKKYVEITTNGITTPRMIFTAPTTYNFQDITKVTELNFGGDKRHIHFKTRYGTGRLSMKLFDDYNDYDAVLFTLRDRASGNIER